MSITKIPQELIIGILNHFQDDTPTLKSCALVCQSWLPPSRSHIFRRISLQPQTAQPKGFFPFAKKSNLHRLYNIIESSPEIASYIRDLSICEGILGREWVAKEKILPLLMGRLANIHRFHLERAASMNLFWKDLSPTMTATLQSVLASPSLVEVKLVGIVFAHPRQFLQVFGDCRGLKTLHVAHVLFYDPESLDNYESLDVTSPVQKEHNVIALEVLSIGARTSPELITCLLHPRSTISVSALRKLSVSISDRFSDFARLLRSVVSLETLEVVLMNDIDLQSYWSLSPSDRISLTHNPNLHSLHFRIDVIQRQDDPLPWLNALLSTVSSSNSLRRIYIVYTLYLPSPYMDRFSNPTLFDAWKEIDATLSNASGFDHLERVKLEFSLENPIGFGIAPRFLKEVRLESPSLIERGILMVDAFDTSR